MTQKEPFSPQRALWKLICLLLALVLTAMLTVSAGFRYLLDQIRCAPESPSPSLSSPVESLEHFLNPVDVNWQQLSSDLTKPDRKTINILLVGQDRREGETLSRADSMILCTFDRDFSRLTMTSFLRDTYLAIPGHGKDRLNAAYAWGGTDLLKQTLAENFKVSIDGAIEVDFSRFSSLIDTLGGVEITLRQDEARLINQNTGSDLEEGLQLLNGEQALAYSRIRTLDSDGDFSRTDRQRKVMKAVVESYRDAGLPVLMKLLKTLLPMLSTDMTEARLLMLALEVFPMLPDLEIVSQSVPSPGSCTDKTIDGMAVLVPDMEAVRKILHETTKSD